VEVQQLNENHLVKVLEHIQLVILMLTLHGFGHDFDESLRDLSEKHVIKMGWICQIQMR
jgi:hypothetical protein